MTRPNQDDMKNICLTVFISYYFKRAKLENAYRLDCLTNATTMIDSLRLTLPKKVKLSLTLAMHRRNNRILRYHKPNETYLQKITHIIC